MASHAVAEFLFQNGFCTVNEVDSCGWSPLHYAALRGEPLLIQSLLEQRADIDCKTKKANRKHGAMKGIVSLDLCMRHGNNEAGRLLISAKASVDSCWLVPHASIGDNAEGVRMLCEAGCSPLARDPLGTLAISVACTFGSINALEELVTSYCQV